MEVPIIGLLFHDLHLDHYGGHVLVFLMQLLLQQNRSLSSFCPGPPSSPLLLSPLVNTGISTRKPLPWLFLDREVELEVEIASR